MHTTAPTKAFALDRDVFDWIAGMPFNVLRPDGLGASSVASGDWCRRHPESKPTPELV